VHLSATTDVGQLASRARARICGSDRSTWLATFVVTSLVFLVTAHWWADQNDDPAAAAWPAWQFVHQGTWDLTGASLPHNVWFAQVHGHLVANRSMGVLLAALPMNLLLGWTHIGAESAGALTAAFVSAVAAANMSVVFRSLVSPQQAWHSAVVLAFGTPVWTVASTALWTHGPDALFLSLGLLFLSRGRHVVAGLALAPLITFRPHMAVAIALIGLWLAWSRRSARPLVALGAPAASAVIALVAWNSWYFGRPSIGGAYVGQISHAVGAQHDALWLFGQNLAGMWFSGWCGLLWYSPFVLVLVACLPAGWQAAPSWARAALVGGVGYQVVQLRVDTFTGGFGFYGNRLAIELMILAAPMAALGYARTSAHRRWVVMMATSLAALAIGVQAVGAFLTDWRVGGMFSVWTTWYPVVVVRAAGWVGWLVTGTAVLAVTLAVARAVRLARSASEAVVVVDQGLTEPGVRPEVPLAPTSA
jgi:hypothetical protein